jgi:hypothetical protein
MISEKTKGRGGVRTLQMDGAGGLVMQNADLAADSRR